MENLNKENFFNQQYEKYPKGVQHFCNWIDQYKLRVGWSEIFNAGVNKNVQWDEHEREYVCSGETKAPKFHDLPYEMQIGIIMLYAQEAINELSSGKSISIDSRIALKANTEELFATLEKYLPSAPAATANP